VEIEENQYVVFYIQQQFLHWFVNYFINHLLLHAIFVPAILQSGKMHFKDIY